MLTVPEDQLRDHVDRELEPSAWLTIDQARINAFADSTLDHQFIHVDEAKAAQTPLGSTIAHGYLTLSLISHFLGECGIAPENPVMALNYGSDRVRFLQPVRAGAKVRGRFRLLSADDKGGGRWLLKHEVTVEIEGGDKPALIAEWLGMQVVGG